MPNQAVVTIVIPTWRRPELLRACLQSLAAQSEQRFRVVVVSNGGGADVESVVGEFARELECRLISFPVNRGFAAGVNAGLERAETKYVAVLNDDVRLDPDWLRVLLDWLEAHPETSFCTGTIFSDDGSRVDNLGDAVARSGAAWRLGFGTPSDAPRDENPRPLLAASWTAILLRRNVFDAVGKLDERFISYLEDVDFAIRCVQKKISGYLIPGARCRHHGGASSNRKSADVFRQMSRNQGLLLEKNFPAELRYLYRSHIRKASWLWLAMALRQGQFLAWAQGKASCLRALPAVRKDRLRWDAEGRQRLMRWLEAGEAAIYADQFGAHRAAPDSYWRRYFAAQNHVPYKPGASGDSRQISESPARRP